MTTYLKKQGFKPSKNETLNNREFREVERLFEVDEELSTLDTPAYNVTKIYELFIDTRAYKDDTVKSILGNLRDETAVITGNASVIEEERGYLITLTFNIGA